MAKRKRNHFERHVTEAEEEFLEKLPCGPATLEALKALINQIATRAFEDGHDNGYLVGKEDGRERP